MFPFFQFKVKTSSVKVRSWYDTTGTLTSVCSRRYLPFNFGKFLDDPVVGQWRDGVRGKWCSRGRGCDYSFKFVVLSFGGQ